LSAADLLALAGLYLLSLRLRRNRRGA